MLWKSHGDRTLLPAQQDGTGFNVGGGSGFNLLVGSCNSMHVAFPTRKYVKKQILQIKHLDTCIFKLMDNFIQV